ncbi:MAG: CZB domain-containing protein [Pseudomonadota bacterium]
MNTASFLINLVVVIGIGIELILIIFGKLSADQLLISSGLSGLVILISFKFLKDALLNLYKLPDSHRAGVQDEINIMDEINAHIAWKIRLQKYLEGDANARIEVDQVMRDDQCELGKWLHGPALQHFGASNTGIKMLTAQHERLHMAAGFVVRNIENNDLAAAKKIMNGEFKKAFHEVMQTLNALNSALMKA